MIDLDWRSVDPKIVQFDATQLKEYLRALIDEHLAAYGQRISQRLENAKPKEMEQIEAAEREELLRDVSQAMLEKFGAWTVGWRFSRGEGTAAEGS